jgi:hypothetical protein
MGGRGRQRQAEIYRGSSRTVLLLRETVAWGKKRGRNETWTTHVSRFKRNSCPLGVHSAGVLLPRSVQGNTKHINLTHSVHCFLSFFRSAAAAYLLQRQLSPTPGYPSQYQLYAMENTRQTILNDYITSQQMQVNLRPDVTRGLSPREQPLGLPYPATRGV